MTEEQWLACTDPTPMLTFLHGKVSVRKLRLFAMACCCRLWYLLSQPARAAIAVAEAYADGQATLEELTQARLKLPHRPHGLIGGLGPARQQGMWDAVHGTLSDVVNVAAVAEAAASASPQEAETRSLSIWLRHLIGNPCFRNSIPQIVLAWNDAAIPSIARTIYDERAFNRLPILADALEDAGFSDFDILNHCRKAGEHVRGCWVVDLLMGME